MINSKNPFEEIVDLIQVLRADLALNTKKVELLFSKSSARDDNEPLTLKEAALYTKYSTHTIYGMVSKKSIPFKKRGRKLYFIKQELREWILNNAK